MAAQFIGLTVFLTLNDPAQTQLRGLVAAVVGQELTLQNALFLSNGYVAPSYRVGGLNILDIEIVAPDWLPPPPPLAEPPPPQPPPPQFESQPPTYSYQNGVALQPQNFHSYTIPQQPISRPATAVPSPAPFASAPFVDPAILSFARQPSVAPSPVPPAAAAAAPIHHKPKQASFSGPSNVSTAGPTTAAAAARPGSLQRKSSSQGVSIAGLKTLNIPSSSNPHPKSAAAGPSRPIVVPPRAPASASATTQIPFAQLSLRDDATAESSAFDETDDPVNFTPTPQDKYTAPEFSGKRSRRGKNNLREPIQKNVVVSPGMFGGPIAQLANAGATGLVPPGVSNKKRRSRRLKQDCRNGDEEGWATEDVNYYKEREFDFQGNLDRFDKKTVFSQIKAEDPTADEARLVSFNRLPRRDNNGKIIGTARNNYKHTENVINTYTTGQSLADRDGWITPDQAGLESSDDSEDDSRGRGEGAALDSGRSSRRAISRQSISRRRAGTRQSNTNNPATRSLDNLNHASSSGGGPATAASSRAGKPTLRLSPSNRPCPIVSPLQMLDVERIAEVELGMTDDMMTENAGRGIAQVAIQAFGKRISASNHNSLPVVLVFAGNNKSGARAIAAGRHLKNHHVRVMVCILGLGREEELLENVRKQLNVFRNAGGRLARWEELASNLKTLDSPPELIIDGLMGLHVSFEDLRIDDQATAFELVQFANKSKASVLAVDIPSGIDGSTGEVVELEGTGAFNMRAKWVVCMGAPKCGLLNALISGIGSGWNLYVADIGISNTAWRKYGTRRRHGVEFAADWVVALEYDAGGINN